MGTKTSELIRIAYYEAERLCDKHGGSVYNGLHQARDIAAKGERQHRAMGRRWVGNIGARETVETCARFFALKGFYTAKRDRSFEHRADFVTAYGAAERVCYRPEGRKAWQAAKRKARAVLALDYCDMIEEKRKQRALDTTRETMAHETGAADAAREVG